MTDRAGVSRWLADYEAAWRTPRTDPLARIFTDDASYRQSPYEQPVIGLDAIRRMWQEEWPYWPEHPHAADNDPS
jgi:ketosteroid isomerase-like protein